MNANARNVSPPVTAPMVTPQPSTSRRGPDWAALVRGVARGLLPLLSLSLATGLTGALCILAWGLTPGTDFFIRRDIVMAIAALGLVVMAVLYAVMCTRALRRIARWIDQGETASAISALIALGLTIIIVALPVILAVLLPQHPAL